METRFVTTLGTGSRSGRRFPAYGPVDAALGYWLFYVVVDRLTPTVVELFTAQVVDFDPAPVRHSLALLLWLVLVVTVLGQLREQVDALVGRDEGSRRWIPESYWLVGHGVSLLVAGAVAALTFDVGIEATRSLLVHVATLDLRLGLLVDVLTVVVFFGSFGVATRSLDRLVVGGLRGLSPL